MQRASFQLESAEVFGDGERIAGRFTARLTGHSSGEITKVEVFQSETPALNEVVDRNQPASV